MLYYKSDDQWSILNLDLTSKLDETSSSKYKEKKTKGSNLTLKPSKIRQNEDPTEALFDLDI